MNQFFSDTYPDEFVLMNDGAVKWLNGDEVLINFDKYCTIFVSIINATTAKPLVITAAPNFHTLRLGNQPRSNQTSITGPTSGL